MNKWMIWGENPLFLETLFPATPGFGGVDEGNGPKLPRYIIDLYCLIPPKMVLQ